MDLTTKAFGAFTLKSAALGEVEAIVATLGVVDRDRDIIAPGAIPEGAPVKLSGYGHDAMLGAPPVGKGHLYGQGDRVHFRGRFFLSTTRGADAFETARELGGDQEWSFGFALLESRAPSEAERSRGARKVLTRLDPFEVSPVMRGAGLGTRTLSAKTLAASSDVAAEYARFVARELALRGAQGPRPPMPLMKFIAFAQYHLGIPEGRMPQIRMVKRFDNPDVVGTYAPHSHAVRLRDDLSGLDLRRTIAHELAHAKEAIDGREHSEEYAEAAAEDVIAAWRRFTTEGM